LWIPSDVWPCPATVVIDIIDEGAPQRVKREDLRVTNDDEKGFGAGDGDCKEVDRKKLDVISKFFICGRDTNTYH